jgi:hypothetical protein
VLYNSASSCMEGSKELIKEFKVQERAMCGICKTTAQQVAVVAGVFVGWLMVCPAVLLFLYAIIHHNGAFSTFLGVSSSSSLSCYFFFCGCV